MKRSLRPNVVIGPSGVQRFHCGDDDISPGLIAADVLIRCGVKCRAAVVQKWLEMREFLHGLYPFLDHMSRAKVNIC